ncbi:MAG TPA: hypothetical protein VGG48_01805 [Rhizomicrobium sp.]
MQQISAGAFARKVSITASKALAANDAVTLAALVRNLLERQAPAKPQRKSARPAKRARNMLDPRNNPRLLVPSEREAAGMAPAAREKFGSGEYAWVLVTFADGYRILAGQYPRAKFPGDFSHAVSSARYQRLLFASGGEHVAADAKCPRVTAADQLTDPAEISAWRDRCFDMRAAAECFAFVPYWEGDVPRSIDWVGQRAREARELAGPLAQPSSWDRILTAWFRKPLWWRCQFGG